MNWSVPRMWEGGDVWILGGGPSVTKMFGIPDEVVRAVKSRTSPPSVYSEYMSVLHDKHVIGINVAFQIGDWIDMVFFGDNNFYLKYREQLAEFPGLKVCCHHQTAVQPWIKFLDKDREHPKGISLAPHLVSWNGNSGAAAISVAAWAGAKRILLLGFDMQLAEDKYQHWHDVYQRGPLTTQEQSQKLKFDIHLLGFPQIAEDAKKLGIEIINVNPDSLIEQFPKFTLKELLWDNS